MSAAPSALVASYTCKHCRQALLLKDPIIIGEAPEAKAARAGQMLADHICQHHKDAAAQIMLGGTNVSGMLFCAQFQHNDDALRDQVNLMRLSIRKMTQRVQITDEMIEQQVERHLATSSPDPVTTRNVVIQLLKTMRDKLEEV